MKNRKYAIESKVYDNGRILISKVFSVVFEQESFSKDFEMYDFYLDVFNNKKAAVKYYNDYWNEVYNNPKRRVRK